jgi:hypothetical protein
MKTLLTFHKSILFILAIALSTTFSACHKEGTGGKSSVSGSVKHHEALIPNCVVYIKYGTKEFPGKDLSKYDASVTADANAHYEIKDLRKGDYYLYGAGYDNSIMETVTGGIAVQLKYNKETETDVPVTE